MFTFPVFQDQKPYPTYSAHLRSSLKERYDKVLPYFENEKVVMNEERVLKVN